MPFSIARRRSLMLWQLLFIILGTSWLWAPHLNPGLSYRTSLISQYETPFQPYSWLFRLADIISGALLILMAYAFLKSSQKKTVSLLLLILGLGLFSDPLLTTTCRTIGASCREYFSLDFFLHAVETVTTSLAFFVLSLYDAWLRKRFVSVAFVIFQLAYGVLFISQLANQDHFNTVSQYVYQVSLIIWIAWFCRDFLIERNYKVSDNEVRVVTFIAAAWAFLNGILAILISLAHIHLLGKIKGLYFAGDSAWLAQHGVIIGVVMLYLSRHLARGEVRARQIFLTITAVETIKYSVVTPSPGLMVLYLLTFSMLFIFRDDFKRGSIALTWEVRLRDLYFLLGALLIAVLASLLALDRDGKVTVIASRSFDNFFDYVARSDITAKSHVSSAVLAHTISAFLVVSVSLILWILFRPYREPSNKGRDYQRVLFILKKYSTSSEDYFKYWPKDKNYFWQNRGQGFIAYKLVGSTVFALADPITNQKSVLVNEFIDWAKARRYKICFLPIYENSLDLYKEAGLETMQIGSSAVISIQSFLNETSNDKWWRWKKNRAVKGGYAYGCSTPPHSSDVMKQFKNVSDSWLTKSGRTEHGFSLGYFDEQYLQECPVHYLSDSSGNIMAFTNQLPQFNPSPIATVDLLRHQPDAADAMPYLIFKTIESCARADRPYNYFDLGFVPFAKVNEPILAIAKTLSAGRFSSRGLEQFKNKFNPDWQDNYMAYDGDIADLAVIALSLEKAMERKT